MASDEVKEIDSVEEIVHRTLLKLASTDAAFHLGSMWWIRRNPLRKLSGSVALYAKRRPHTFLSLAFTLKTFRQRT